MPFGRTTESRERIESSNMVNIPDGTREFEVVDAWLYNVVEETATSERTGKEYTKRTYTADNTDQQDCKLTLRLVKRPDIVINDTLRVYLGSKSKFAQLMESLIGVAPGDELERYLLTGQNEFDVKATSKTLRHDLVSKIVLCKTEYTEATGYVRVKAYTAKPNEDDDLAGIPPKTQPKEAPPVDNGFDNEIRDEIPF